MMSKSREHLKFERLLIYKKELQRLESDFSIKSNRLIKLKSQVLSLGQKISMKRQRIIDGIN